MRIYSIFKAIEGEGSEIGIPKTFIRTVGCPVGCKNCDTPEALNRNAGKEMSEQEIIETVENFGLKYITITGGEPLIQPGLYSLVTSIVNRGYHTSLETSGQLFDENIFNIVDFISIDAKTPSTGVKCDLKIHKDVLEKYCNKLQIKCVVNDLTDFAFVVNYYNYFKEFLKLNQMVITPCWEVKKDLDKNFVKVLIEKILESKLPIRVIIQQHKIIYGPKATNV